MNDSTKSDLKELGWLTLAMLSLGILILSVLAALAGCSTLVQQPALDQCFSRKCPSDEQLNFVHTLVTDKLGDFDTSQPVQINWYPFDYVFRTQESVDGGPTFSVIGQSLDKNTIEVTSANVMIHELMHVYFWRKLDDPDSDHASGVGPWTDETDNMIRDLENQLKDQRPDIVVDFNCRMDAI